MGSLPYVASIDMSSLPQVVINGTRTKYVDSIKNLGVTITPTLNWDLHVGKIQAKVYGPLKPLNFDRRSLPFEMKKQLFQSLIMPHFDYASVVYNHLDTRLMSSSCPQRLCNWLRFLYLVV